MSDFIFGKRMPWEKPCFRAINDFVGRNYNRRPWIGDGFFDRTTLGRDRFRDSVGSVSLLVSQALPAHLYPRKLK